MKEKQIIKIKYHDKDMPKIEKIPIGDWVDLRIVEDVDLKAGESYVASLGVSIKIPEGYEAIVAPRSSSFKHFGFIMTNSIGVIDRSYCGDDDIWRIPLFAMKDVHIKKYDRVCQFRILKNQPELEFVEVETLGNKSRGGFGSTGTK